MVKIKLARTGKKNQPSYRVVVQEARAKRDGRVVEIIGSYLPLAQGTRVTIDKDRLAFWIGRGARPTTTVSHLVHCA